MPRITPWTAVAVLVWVIAFTVRVEESRLARERERTGAAVLAASNLVAERDSTRQVGQANARVARMLGDSLGVVERRVRQVAQRADALDRALGRERVARYAAVAVVDSLSRVVAASVDTSANEHAGDVRVAKFNLRNPPYTVDADVAMPAPPDSARIQLRIGLDPIPIDTRVSCGPADAGGIREAMVSVATPKWASVRIGAVEQAAGVCASPALKPPNHRRSLLGLRRLMIGLGPAIGTDRHWRWALFVGPGFVLSS